MSTVADVRNALIAVLRRLDGVRVVTSPGMPVHPPAVAVGLPELTWERMGSDPSSAKFEIALIAAANEHTADVLLRLYPQVVEALDDLPETAVLTAAPGTFPAGSADLPAYLIEIEVSL